MSSDLDSRTPQFGLRDFLFYLVPGGIILISILLISSAKFSDLRNIEKNISGFGISILGILLAYYFGQVVYLLTYPLRIAIDKLRNIDDTRKEGNEDFEKCHFYAINDYPAYYAAVIFRDRSFARFSLAMVSPSILFGITLGQVFPGHNFFLISLGLISAAGFIIRYIHYDNRYKGSLIRIIKNKQESKTTSGD